MENLEARSALGVSNNHSSATGALQLPKLQRIMDQVWVELRANGTLSGPADPETAHGKIARRVMFYEIGRQVMSCANNHRMSEAEITRAVVKSVSLAYRLEPDSEPRPVLFMAAGFAREVVTSTRFG